MRALSQRLRSCSSSSTGSPSTPCRASVRRTSASLVQWLQPAFDEALVLEPDLDKIEALSSERDGLWKRVSAAEFLSEDEKRAELGYGTRAKPE